MKKLLVITTIAVILCSSCFGMETAQKQESAAETREEFYKKYPNIFDGFSPKYKEIIYNYIKDQKTKNVRLVTPDVKDAKKIGTSLAWKAIAQYFGLSSYVWEGYIHFADVDSKLMRGKRAPINIENFERYKKEEDCQKNFKMSCAEAQEALLGLYKIHLMPKPDDFNTVVIMFLEELQKNKKLQELLQLFKIHENPEYRQTTKPELIMPKIVLYAAGGKDKAQELLNSIAHLYKDREGADITPRFNEKITSLIFYAQGDGIDKKESNQHYFELFFKHYKKDFTGKDRDYHLINPVTGKRVE